MVSLPANKPVWSVRYYWKGVKEPEYGYVYCDSRSMVLLVAMAELTPEQQARLDRKRPIEIAGVPPERRRLRFV